MQITEKYNASIDETNPGKITVVATTFGPRENGNGMKLWYTKEAFATVAENITSDTPMPMYIEHNDSTLPIGQWNEATITESGMELTGQIFMETTNGKDAYAVLKGSKLFNSVSISTSIDDYKMVDETGKSTDDNNGYVYPISVGVSEVSLVISPANKSAVIKNVEHLINTDVNIRTLEHSLRDAGLSNANAKTAISIIKSMTHQNSANEQLCVDSETDSTTKETLVDDSMVLTSLDNALTIYSLNERLKNEFNREGTGNT